MFNSVSMKKICMLMAIFAIALCANAQPLNRQTINDAVKQDYARYQALTERFIAGDATLTPDEVRLVYYGYTANPSFRPNATYPGLQEAYDANDFTKTLDLARLGLSANPVSLPLLFKAYACSTVSLDADTKAKAKVYQTRINQICDAIFESGKGVGSHSPYVVIRSSDIDPFIKNYLQPTAIIDQSKVGSQLAVKMKIEGVPNDVILYFDLF